MYLCDGKIGNEYKVEDIDLPVNIEKRLEALGMTRGTSIAVLNSKSRGVLIVKVRGTRFALGRNITKNILAEIASQVGYENQSKFATAFRDVMKIAPAEYRKQNSGD